MKKKKHRIKIWHIIVTLLLIPLVLSWIGVFKDDRLAVITAKPQLKTIIESIPANGKIRPVVEVTISPDVSGEIIDLYYEEGDKIRKGDLILTIRQDLYISAVEREQAALNSSKAQYMQQKAQLREAELKYKRSCLLFRENAIPEAEYETSETGYNIALEQLKASEYMVKSSEASLKEAEDNLKKTSVYSPIDGIISKMNVEKGERVVGTSQMAGTEMLRIADFSKMEVVVNVNENDIIRIRQNDTARIEVDAYPDRVFKGVITHISNSASEELLSSSQVTNYGVKAAILQNSCSDLTNNSQIPFRPGMSASISIITEKKERILALPLQCVIAKEGKLIVWVVDKNNRIEAREVKAGIQDINSIEILSGIDENDDVVTGPYSAINETLDNGVTVSRNKENTN